MTDPAKPDEERDELREALADTYAAGKALSGYVWRNCAHNNGEGHAPWLICRVCILAYFRALAARAPAAALAENQIAYMVTRFLQWKLPANFTPDAGISFKATYNEYTAHPAQHEPVGTNLFDAEQAEAMVRHMLDGMPGAMGGGMK